MKFKVIARDGVTAAEYSNILLAKSWLADKPEKYYISVYSDTGTLTTILWNLQDVADYTGDFYDMKYSQKVDTESYLDILEEEPVEKDAINPTHYKNVAAGKQYMELMVDMLKGKDGVESHLFGQIYKYLMRCGSKDDEVQELQKSLWYLNALITYKQTGKVLVE